jgi:hypothetical protein
MKVQLFCGAMGGAPGAVLAPLWRRFGVFAYISETI